MGRKRKRLNGDVPLESGEPTQIVAAQNDESLRLRWPLLVSLALLGILYAWMATWFDDFLYKFFTTHVVDNVRVFGAYLNLLASVPPAIIAERLKEVLIAGAIFASAFSLGRLTLDFFSIPIPAEDWGRIAKPLALGLGLFSEGLLLLGLCGGWTKGVMCIVVGAPLAFAAVKYRRELLERPKGWRLASWLQNLTYWETAGFGLLGLFLAMTLLGCFGPEYFYDSLVYHLALPQLYLLNHRIIPTPTMIYSGVPQGTEMLYGLALALGSPSLAKLIHWEFGVAVMVTAYAWTKRQRNRRAALLAAVLFISTPMVCFESVTAMVELPMAFYLTLALLILIDAAAAASKPDARRLLILAGAFAGFGLGTKYNAGLYVPILTAPLLLQGFAADRQRRVEILSQVMTYLAVAFVAFSPWLVKNWIFYRDPVYPFVQSCFRGSPTSNLAGLMADAHARNLHEALTTWNGLRDIILGIWNPTAHRVDSYLGPALEAGLPLLLIARWDSSALRAQATAVVGIWLVWAIHTSLPRFIMPAVPIYCILLGIALHRVRFPQWLRVSFLSAAWYSVAISLAAIFMMLSASETWRVSYGRTDSTEYLLHEHPSYSAPYYAAAQYINAHAPQSATVLFLGEERGFYCQRRFITASVFDTNPAQPLAEAAADSAELSNALKTKGVNYLLVNAGSAHYQQWLQKLSTRGRRNLEGLFRSEASLAFDYDKQDSPTDRSWVQVYKL